MQHIQDTPTMNQKTVLHLDLGSSFRGGQRQVLHLACFQANHSKWLPLVMAPQGTPLLAAAQEKKISTLSLGSRWEYDPRNLMALQRVIRSSHVGIIHTHDSRSAGLGAMLKLLFPSMILVHSRRVSYRPSFIGAWKYGKGDAVVCVSQEIMDVMAGIGLKRHRLHVLHSGIDPSRYQHSDTDKKRSCPRLALLGAFTLQKGHEVFLQALAGMTELPWEVVFAGEGPLRKEMEALAQSLGLEGRIHFAGYVDSRELLPTVDILVIPSLEGEGSSAVIKEGWVCNVPVVVSDLPSNLELVRHQETGLVFGRKDPDTLCQALMQLLQDAALREGLIQRGRMEMERYTVDVMGQGYEAIYETLWNKR